MTTRSTGSPSSRVAYGGAKLSHGLALASTTAASRGESPIDLSVIANTGDDLELHGLSVSPDLDTLLYTLAGLANEQTGWGVRDETWSSAGDARAAGCTDLVPAGRP